MASSIIYFIIIIIIVIIIIIIIIIIIVVVVVVVVLVVPVVPVVIRINNSNTYLLGYLNTMSVKYIWDDEVRRYASKEDSKEDTIKGTVPKKELYNLWQLPAV